jgi:hypothetical protein
MLSATRRRPSVRPCTAWNSLGKPRQAPDWRTALDVHVQLRLGRTVAVEPLLTTVDDTFAVATPTAIGHYLRNTASSPR